MQLLFWTFIGWLEHMQLFSGCSLADLNCCNIFVGRYSTDLLFWSFICWLELLQLRLWSFIGWLEMMQLFIGWGERFYYIPGHPLVRDECWHMTTDHCQEKQGRPSFFMSLALPSPKHPVCKHRDNCPCLSLSSFCVPTLYSTAAGEWAS